MATIKARAPYFGVVEPNHLSAQRNGQVYAQLPAKDNIEVLENGQFANYHYSAGCVDFDATEGAEWMLVLNEVKLYGESYKESYKDFALQKKNFTDGIMTPRLLKTAVGDIMTLNTVPAGTYSVGDILKIDANGYLSASGTSDMEWTVVAETTLPDAITEAIKVQRTK